MAATAIGDDRLAVLGEALQEAIGGRRVRTAVFTTFTFDPGFFELHVLPNLFSQPFHQVDKIKRIQLEDALRSTKSVSVYYDAEGISPDATPAQLDVARIGLRRRTGCFHPKLVLALVDEHLDEDWGETLRAKPPQSLVVGTFSANLTRSGWWENVETGHFEVIADRTVSDEPCSFRKDLLRLIGTLRSQCNETDDQVGLALIEDFLKQRATKSMPANRMRQGRFYTRLFAGQAPLHEWLSEVGLKRFEWNLEIVSPFFDSGDAAVLRRLIEATRPAETRVFLPCDASGEALVQPAFRDSVAEMAKWCDLPVGLQQRGSAKLRAEATTRRRVHAKVYRFWNRDGQEVILTGSVNLTTPAHTSARGGNVEAAFLVDTGHLPGKRRWWLRPLDHDPPCAEQVPDETGDAMPVFLDLHVRYDWSQHLLAYRLDSPADGPLEIGTLAGRAIVTIAAPKAENWIALPNAAADEVRSLLDSTSFLQVRHAKGTWRILVREEGMHQRPSLLRHLSPEDILRYWSLLSDEQRSAFIETQASSEATLEGIPVRIGRLPVVETVFDRVAGLFHAFEHQHRRLSNLLDEDHDREVRTTLFGTKYDSVPVLLKKVSEAEDRDPVMTYLTFLCARQLLDRVVQDHPAFLQTAADDRKHLDRELRRIADLRTGLLADDPQRLMFLGWYESMFSGVLAVEGAS